MPNIAIVDDRKNDRDTVTKVVASTLKAMKQDADGWGVISDAPPSDQHDIVAWLDENDAMVLVTDWKLNEGSKNNRIVDYEADKLIKEVRAKRPTFPIYVITGFEKEARAYLKDVEGVLSRNDFTKTVGSVVPQMVRAGRRRYEEHRTLFRRMDVTARRVASGKATAKEKKELESLQGFFQAELPVVVGLDSVLSDLEATSTRAKELRTKVEARLAKGKKRKV
jgi:hypothetical protein